MKTPQQWRAEATAWLRFCPDEFIVMIQKDAGAVSEAAVEVLKADNQALRDELTALKAVHP